MGHWQGHDFLLFHASCVPVDYRADVAASSSVLLSGHQCDPYDISSTVTKGFLLLQ